MCVQLCSLNNIANVQKQTERRSESNSNDVNLAQGSATVDLKAKSVSPTGNSEASGGKEGGELCTILAWYLRQIIPLAPSPLLD